MAEKNTEKESKSLEQKLKDRIIELRNELQTHQMKLNAAQQVVQQETEQIIAKQGAIKVMQDLVFKKTLNKE